MPTLTVLENAKWNCVEKLPPDENPETVIVFSFIESLKSAEMKFKLLSKSSIRKKDSCRSNVCLTSEGYIYKIKSKVGCHLSSTYEE